MSNFDLPRCPPFENRKIFSIRLISRIGKYDNVLRRSPILFRKYFCKSYARVSLKLPARMVMVPVSTVEVPSEIQLVRAEFGLNGWPSLWTNDACLLASAKSTF